MIGNKNLRREVAGRGLAQYQHEAPRAIRNQKHEEWLRSPGSGFGAAHVMRIVRRAQLIFSA